MGRLAKRYGRVAIVAVLAVGGWAVGTAPADAGKKQAPQPFARHWGAKPPPPVFDPFSFAQHPQTSVQYWGGPVLRTNETFVIFWDPAGQLSQSYRDLVLRYFQDVAADHGDNVYAVQNQYYDSTGPIVNQSTYIGSAVDTDPYPAGCPAVSDFPTCFNNDQLIDELDSFVNSQGIARPANRGFFVFTPPGVNTCFDAEGQVCATNRFCAYHSNGHGTHGDFLYAIMPFAARPFCEPPNVGHPNGNDADAAINVASHEHREMISDPFVGDATVFGPPLAWADENTGDETSDKCAFYYGAVKDNGVGMYNQVINGHQYLLQTEWSNALAADDGLGCVQNGSDQAPVATFETSLSGPTMTADASASHDPDAGDSVGGIPAFWEFGDGTAARGTVVKHRYASPGSYPVSVTVTDQFGASDIETRVVKVTNPRPAPTHSFSANFDVNIENNVFGFGNASGMGAAGTESFGLDVDFTDAPYSFRFFFPVDFIVRLSNTDDQIYADFTITLTDLASPPAGNNYTVAGTYVFQGGQGRYVNAGGSGTITGTCTSAFDRNDADCTLLWKGTISGD